MNRRIIGISLIVSLLVLTLAGIGISKDSEWITTTRIGNPKAKIELEAWVGRDESLQSPYSSIRGYVTESRTAWAKRHPNVKIKLHTNPAGEISVTAAKLMAVAAAGNAPDFAHIDSFWIGSFIKRGLVQPIDIYMTQKEIDSFYDFTKKATMSEGRQYAIWGETDARFLYYRKDWIQEPPRTWDELIDTALKMKKEHNVYGFLTKAVAEGACNENTWPYLWAQGGKIVDEKGKPVFGEGKNREIMLNILKFDKRLVESGAAPKMIASMTSFDPILAEVKAGHVAMFIEGSWAWGQIGDLIGKKERDEKYDIAPYPQMKPDQYGNSNGGWTWAIFTKDPVKQALAYSFIYECIGGEAAMAERAKIYGYIPTRKDVMKDYVYFATNPLFQKFAKWGLECGGVRPATTLYPLISDAVATAVGKVLTGRLSPEKALDEAYEKAIRGWKESR